MIRFPKYNIYYLGVLLFLIATLYSLSLRFRLISSNEHRDLEVRLFFIFVILSLISMDKYIHNQSKYNLLFTITIIISLIAWVYLCLTLSNIYLIVGVFTFICLLLILQTIYFYYIRYKNKTELR